MQLIIVRFLKALHWNIIKIEGRGGYCVIDRSAKINTCGNKTFVTFSFTRLVNTFNVVNKTIDHSKFSVSTALEYNKGKGTGGNCIINRKAKINTWKCFVRPGVAETGTFLSFKRVLIVELFPTFGYPTCKDIGKTTTYKKQKACPRKSLEQSDYKLEFLRLCYS